MGRQTTTPDDEPTPTADQILRDMFRSAADAADGKAYDATAGGSYGRRRRHQIALDAGMNVVRGKNYVYEDAETEGYDDLLGEVVNRFSDVLDAAHARRDGPEEFAYAFRTGGTMVEVLSAAADLLEAAENVHSAGGYYGRPRYVVRYRMNDSRGGWGRKTFETEEEAELVSAALVYAGRAKVDGPLGGPEVVYEEGY